MSPVEVVEAFGAFWADHDLDRALAMVTDDCVFDATGPAPDGARAVGPGKSAKRGPQSSTTQRRALRPRKPSLRGTAWSSAGVTAGTAGTFAASTCSRYAGNRSPKNCPT